MNEHILLTIHINIFSKLFLITIKYRLKYNPIMNPFIKVNRIRLTL